MHRLHRIHATSFLDLESLQSGVQCGETGAGEFLLLLAPRILTFLPSFPFLVGTRDSFGDTFLSLERASFLGVIPTSGTDVEGLAADTRAVVCSHMDNWDGTFAEWLCGVTELDVLPVPVPDSTSLCKIFEAISLFDGHTEGNTNLDG